MKKIDLTEGSIINKLLQLSLPIIGTSFVQIAYNLTDMLWLGRLGSQSVAAVGTAGFFVWFAMAFIALAKTGTEIKVAQKTGNKEENEAKCYARAGLHIAFFIALAYSFIVVVFRHRLISIFQISEVYVNEMAADYLFIVGSFLVFTFINQVFTGIFNGRGDSKTPFLMNTIGLVINIILDPLLIFGFLGLPKLGILGAAAATVIAQAIVTILFFKSLRGNGHLFENFIILKREKCHYVKDIIKLSFPTALQSGFFTIIMIQISIIIASFGATAIAIQKVGSQIESLSWMTAQGLTISLGAFIGQNYGASKYKRVLKGYYTALKIAMILGLVNTILFVFGSEFIMKLFFPLEQDAVIMGADYLRILGYSQLFMCIEITTMGAFNGVGKTIYPAVNSIVFTLLRIPMAMFLSQPHLFGLNGVWWSITISSVFKGVVLVSLWIWYVRKQQDFQMTKIHTI